MALTGQGESESERERERARERESERARESEKEGERRGEGERERERERERARERRRPKPERIGRADELDPSEARRGWKMTPQTKPAVGVSVKSPATIKVKPAANKVGHRREEAVEAHKKLTGRAAREVVPNRRATRRPLRLRHSGLEPKLVFYDEGNRVSV